MVLLEKLTLAHLFTKVNFSDRSRRLLPSA